MPMVNPLTNGSDLIGFTGGGNYDVGANARRTADSGGSPPIGAGSLRSSHNTPMHCAGLILIALVVVFALGWGGFRFAFDVGMGRS